MLGLTALPHRALAQPPPPAADHARARERGLRAPTSGARRSCVPATAARTSTEQSSAALPHPPSRSNANRPIRIQRLTGAGRSTGLAGRRGSATSPAQAQVFGPGVQEGRRFGQMGQAGIGPAQKRGFGPNFFDIFPKKL